MTGEKNAQASCSWELSAIALASKMSALKLCSGEAPSAPHSFASSPASAAAARTSTSIGV
jgi:hypothetical protein